MYLLILYLLVCIPLIAIIVFICNLFRFILAKITVYSNDIEDRKRALVISGISAAVLTGTMLGIVALLGRFIPFM